MLLSAMNSAMNSAIYAAIFFTVLLLVTTAYFLMGGLPLLILKHDTPVDARFIRSFFKLYYKFVFINAAGAATSFALSGRPGFALGITAIALAVFVIRRKLLPAMDRLSDQIQAGQASAVEQFRRLHSTALLANLAQLVVLVWGLTKVSL